MTDAPSPRRTADAGREASDALVRDPAGALERLREIMRRLRAPDGCPWDRDQDFASIAKYTVEEAYEVADAIERNDMEDLKDELGDLLLQVVYHAQMADEAGHFDFDDVARAVSDKMLRRHPHVFGDETGLVRELRPGDWERMKAEERAAKGKVEPAGASALDGVALGLPALTRAVKLQARAARVGFDWPDLTGVMAKVVEEAGELAEAHETLTADEVEAEFGDLAFVLANLARHLKVEPEHAIRRTNAKFERRFREVERRLAARGRRPEEAGLAEMDAIWDEIRAEEKAAAGAPAADAPRPAPDDRL
ncbi:nucleoside triphosphate pyrophosphohydrolase [Albimonas sp. CAU 1670]|uniref:nucleoside triphosphate pyrophosphohydrolase n=1 Tax=Albimonas sp. CAU 1670 TaxID=3032599 RepID=UPI0023D9A44E|nr:nucleoside triphosphate pyrophosphohydrolase [Albimonas sp. CAU 1670]MDF2232974.1 nucleoside triphosphate pyrophosphohydrolase [Albimonas sp. CAU 1670]